MRKNNDVTEVRLFISSTFQDMQEERNYLMKRVAPRLRELCATYGLNFFCYDLRWGITAEMQEENGTLRSCLNAVENSKPFFVGILGERYGWIPDDDDILSEFGEDGKGKSITELEILCGISAAKEGFCSFYLRDPQASGDFVETDSFRIEALRELKDFVRNSSYPCYENYKTAEEFGEQLYRDFAKWLEENFDQGSDLEKNKQKAYIGTLARVAYGNSEIEGNILAWLKEERPLYVWTEGEMLSAILNTNPRFAESEEFDLISVNLAASLFLRSAYDVMRYILKEANALYPDKVMIPELPPFAFDSSVEEKAALGAAFRSFCENTTLEKPIVILITNPELFESRNDRMFTWMPSVLGDSVRVIAVSEEEEFVTFLNTREWHTRRITFDKASHMLFLNEYFDRMGKRLSHRQIDLLYEESSLIDDYGTTMLLAEALTKGTVFDELDEKLGAMVAASQRGVPSVSVIEDLFMTKLTWDEQDIYYKTYPFLVESGFSIREEELYEAISLVADCPLATWHKVQAEASSVLTRVNGNIVITNKAVREHMATYAYVLNQELDFERVMDVFTAIYHRRYLHAMEEDQRHQKRYTVDLAKLYLSNQTQSSQKAYFQDFFQMRKQATAAFLRNDPGFFRFLVFLTKDSVDWMEQYRENDSAIYQAFARDFGEEEGKRLFIRLFQTMKFFDKDDLLPEGRTIEQTMRYEKCSPAFLELFFEMRDAFNEIDSQETLDAWYEKMGAVFADVKEPHELCAFYWLMANYANQYTQNPFRLRMAKMLIHYACETDNDFALSVGIYFAARAYLLYGEEGYRAAASLFALSESYARSIGDFYTQEVAAIFNEKMNG